MSLADQLKENMEQASWEMLKDHFERGALVVVHEDLDLIEVGVAIAEDQVKEVQDWLDAQMLQKPEPITVESWPAEKTFNFIIIQPYVLVQNRPN